MFETEFCKVTFDKENNIVLIAWKKFCCGDNYRKPTLFALDLLKNNEKSNLVIDARNGFEDEKQDVDWAFKELLPNMAKTDCKAVVFIMNKVNNIDGEIDMWSNEFMKYFSVYSVLSFSEAMEKINLTK